MAATYKIDIVCNIRCERAIAGLKKQAGAAQAVDRELKQLQVTAYAVTRAQTLMMRQAMRSTYAFFWTGLSVMFAAMGIARFVRQIRSLERRYETYYRAQLEVVRLTHEYRRAVIESGRYSEEAVRIHQRLTLAQMRLRRASSELGLVLWFELGLAVAQLIFGLLALGVRIQSHILLTRMAEIEERRYLASLIHRLWVGKLLTDQEFKAALAGLFRAFTTRQLTEEEWRCWLSQFANLQVTKQLTLAHLLAGKSAVAHAAGIKVLGLSLKMLIPVIGGALVLFGLMAWHLSSVEQETKKMFETLRREMEQTYRASPIKIKAGVEWIELEKIGEELRAIVSPEVRAPRFRITPYVGYPIININIQQPIVRRDIDIENLAREVSRKTAEALIRITGKW